MELIEIHWHDKDMENDTENTTTTRNFEYAVNLNAPLVALFKHNQNGWEFVRGTSRCNGIKICQLEHQYNNQELYIFPFGSLPDQMWAWLLRLEKRGL